MDPLLRTATACRLAAHFFGHIGDRASAPWPLASLLQRGPDGGCPATAVAPLAACPACRTFAPKAKRVIYLFQSGAPSQLDLFDYKPKLADLRGTELPDSIRQGQRLTGMTSRQASFPVAPSKFRFAQHGQCGAWVSELLPHTARVADELCFIKSMHTEAINHDPAITFFQTGAQLAGRPSIGAWLAYGLGSENHDLPAFVVMISQGTGNPTDQPLYDRLWGSGFLPTQYQGVKFRSGGDPVLYPVEPAGHRRRRPAAACSTTWPQLNQLKLERVGDPEIATRIAQYEMAFRMQTSVPELTDLSERAASTIARPVRPRRRRSRARSPPTACSPAGWPSAACGSSSSSTAAGTSTPNLPKQIAGQCRDTDQPSAALIADLKQRGLLDDTLVVWGGEFGRTVYCQGKLTADDYGRDHHPRCFTIWLAGGGIKPGITYGADRRLLLQHRRGPGPRPRPARDDPAPAWASTTRG